MPTQGSPAPELSVIVPVYNEAAVLRKSLAEVTAHLEKLGRPFELVCVDDGSTDGSGAILAELASREGRARVERHEKNRGKGAAVRTGVFAARGKLVVFLDADLSTPLAHMTELLETLEGPGGQGGCDVALGSRRAPGASIDRHQPWLRETLGKGFARLVRIVVAPDIHDFTCGFKGFRAGAARAIFERARIDGWAFDAELVVIARRHGLSIREVPVQWRHAEGSKVRIGSAVVRSLADLLVIQWNRLRGAYR